MEVIDKLHPLPNPQPLYFCKNRPQYPLSRSLGGLHSRSECCEEGKSILGIEKRLVQP